eukprot:5443716-Alexandrium_andersonii.AAC.1
MSLHTTGAPPAGPRSCATRARHPTEQGASRPEHQARWHAGGANQGARGPGPPTNIRSLARRRPTRRNPPEPRGSRLPTNPGLSCHLSLRRAPPCPVAGTRGHAHQH